jgi:hypothetical protein
MPLQFLSGLPCGRDIRIMFPIVGDQEVLLVAQLRFEGRDDEQYNQFRDDYRNAFCPNDVAWRRLVLREGPKKIDQLTHGVLAWHV